MSLQWSYYPNYFSIEDILATQERTSCKFLNSIPKLGKLNPAAEDEELKAGTVLELPIWLVQALSSGRNPIVTPDLPRIYKEAYREILKADATAVDLHKFNVHFYELGSYVRKFDPRGEVSTILVHTFKSRVRFLMDLAENGTCDPFVLDKLDTLEKELFRVGHVARQKLNTWLNESDAPLEAANMVTTHKKRKRVEIEDMF